MISDTHGLLRPEVVRALAGVDLIIHAGDIGKPEVLVELKKIAPVVAIKGNNDSGDWARRLPEVRKVKVGQHRFYVIHDVNELGFDPLAQSIRVVDERALAQTLDRRAKWRAVRQPRQPGAATFQLALGVSKDLGRRRGRACGNYRALGLVSLSLQTHRQASLSVCDHILGASASGTLRESILLSRYHMFSVDFAAAVL